MHINQVAVAHSQSWIASGWELFRKDTSLWLAMAALYLVVALLLQEIPFVGYLILVLLTPLAAVGAVSLVHAQASDRVVASSGPVHELFARAARQFMRVLADGEHSLSVMVVATLTLGAMVVIQILAQLLKVGGAALPAMLAGSVGPSIWLPALLSLIVVWLLKLGLILISLFATYLIVLRRQTPLVAMETGIRICGKNLLPLSLIALAFLVPLGVVNYLKDPYRLAAVFLIGLVALPLFIASSFSAYRDLLGK